ncbi:MULTISPECIES: hypothetical protein [Sorangium]|uniref:Uncharacterized protein n=1 Tax=Sorangium cellulosum TaxID=56 RepID=A0A4P2QJI5_SORCE|nr:MULTISPECIES: hypothetical protein [Sorangium]AUX29868.1 uncharacterized protein SOCE836_019610 [Sorangium cellulosum]WCQ89256.1 hypothetical protein NQZ70_01943 [Sorangium sp. Soce836]
MRTQNDEVVINIFEYTSLEQVLAAREPRESYEGLRHRLTDGYTNEGMIKRLDLLGFTEEFVAGMDEAARERRGVLREEEEKERSKSLLQRAVEGKCIVS